MDSLESDVFESSGDMQRHASPPASPSRRPLGLSTGGGLIFGMNDSPTASPKRLANGFSSLDFLSGLSSRRCEPGATARLGASRTISSLPSPHDERPLEAAPQRASSSPTFRQPAAAEPVTCNLLPRARPEASAASGCGLLGAAPAASPPEGLGAARAPSHSQRAPHHRTPRPTERSKRDDVVTAETEEAAEASAAKA